MKSSVQRHLSKTLNKDLQILCSEEAVQDDISTFKRKNKKGNHFWVELLLLLIGVWLSLSLRYGLHLISTFCTG